MAYYGGLEGILTGLTKSTDHPSTCNGPGVVQKGGNAYLEAEWT